MRQGNMDTRLRALEQDRCLIYHMTSLSHDKYEHIQVATSIQVGLANKC